MTKYSTLGRRDPLPVRVPEPLPLHEGRRVAARMMIDDRLPGAIVNTASEAGKVGHVDSLAYSASKAAVISMTRVLADAYSAKVGEDPAAIYAQMISEQLGRHTTLEEVAGVYSFLLGDAARTIRGQAINADAGGTPY